MCPLKPVRTISAPRYRLAHGTSDCGAPTRHPSRSTHNRWRAHSRASLTASRRVGMSRSLHLVTIQRATTRRNGVQCVLAAGRSRARPERHTARNRGSRNIRPARDGRAANVTWTGNEVKPLPLVSSFSEPCVFSASRPSQSSPQCRSKTKAAIEPPW